METLPGGRRRPGPDRPPVPLGHRQPRPLVERREVTRTMLRAPADAVEGFGHTPIGDDEHPGVWRVSRKLVHPHVEESRRCRREPQLLPDLADEARLGALASLQLPPGQLPLSPLVLEE